MFLTEKERLETIKACRYCPMCHVADRVAGIVKRESYTPRGRAAIVFGIEQGLIEIDEKVGDIFYTTQNDGLLAEWCVGNYDHEELVIDMRARIFEKGFAPEEVVNFLDDLKGKQEGKSSPKEFLARGGVTFDDTADVLLYCGCSALSDSQSAIISMGKLLNQAQVGFQVLEHEPCCGWPFYQLGDFTGAKEFSGRIADTIRSTGASTVVALDADCFRMLTTRTRRFGGVLEGVRITHSLNMIADLMDKQSIKITEPIKDAVTYHDPCALARYCEDIETPRKILRAICSEELKEIEPGKKLAQCCGEGGMLKVYRPDVAEKVAVLRLEEARETGAALLTSGCPRCVSSFSNAMESQSQSELKIEHLVDLVAKAAKL